MVWGRDVTLACSSTATDVLASGQFGPKGFFKLRRSNAVAQTPLSAQPEQQQEQQMLQEQQQQQRLAHSRQSLSDAVSLDSHVLPATECPARLSDSGFCSSSDIIDSRLLPSSLPAHQFV